MDRSTAAVANAFFLFVGVAGLIIQIASGVRGLPDIPLGTVLLIGGVIAAAVTGVVAVSRAYRQVAVR